MKYTAAHEKFSSFFLRGKKDLFVESKDLFGGGHLQNQRTGVILCTYEFTPPFLTSQKIASDKSWLNRSIPLMSYI